MMTEPAKPITMIGFQLDLATVELVIEGLQELPHKRVANMIASMRMHVADTLKQQQEQAPPLTPPPAPV